MKSHKTVIKNDLNLDGFYIHTNRDREQIKIQGFDEKGNCWVTWKKDGFKNMVSVSNVLITKDEHAQN